jgi:hypothetical protein
LRGTAFGIYDALIRAAANHPEESVQYIFADQAIIDEPTVEDGE